MANNMNVDIFYLTVDRYSQFNPKLPPNKDNPGGGIADKTVTVLKAWKEFYRVGVSERIDDYPDADILIVEPLWFKLRGGLHDVLQAPDMEQALSDYENHRAEYKILYLSEFTFLKYPKPIRDRIINASTVVTSNCDYQAQYCDAFGIDTVRLCDPIDDSLLPAIRGVNPKGFEDENRYAQHPSIEVYKPRSMSVVTFGKISLTKRSDQIIELYRALRDFPVETIYIGNAGLWGDSTGVDRGLEWQLQREAVSYYPSLTMRDLMKRLNSYACGIFDSYHDSCCASNLIALMCGVQCFYGRHGCWEGRPGVAGLDTVDDFVTALKAETEDFTKIPSDRNAGKEWALANYSSDAFIKDWRTLLKEIDYAGK